MRQQRAADTTAARGDERPDVTGSRSNDGGCTDDRKCGDDCSHDGRDERSLGWNHQSGRSDPGWGADGRCHWYAS